MKGRAEIEMKTQIISHWFDRINQCTVKPDLTTTCEQRHLLTAASLSHQRPVYGKSQFYQTPLSNGHFFQVPRVVVVHRFDCNVWLTFQSFLFRAELQTVTTYNKSLFQIDITRESLFTKHIIQLYFEN
jgi:hypothetical protein